MQEIKKQSIVIASILKPVDDTRMLEKMANSLAKSGKWDIHIIGYGNAGSVKDIQVHALGAFNRISLQRVLSPFRVLLMLFRISPRVLIVNTHELLIAASVFKLFSNCKVIYDVTENYFLNITHTKAFPSPLRHIIAYWVRMKEWITRPMISHYLLAEQCYQKELPFIGTQFTIVENKCVVPEHFKRKVSSNAIRLLFTGTIDTSTGIWEAIELSKSLHSHDGHVELHIAGYCPRKDLRIEILKEITTHPFISFNGLDKLISHSKILDEISGATAGVIFYPPSIHNKSRIPTKVYEYIACQLPILFDHSAEWKNLIVQSKAGIGIHFRNPDHRAILDQLVTKSFYTHPNLNVNWSAEERKFLDVIE